MAVAGVFLLLDRKNFQRMVDRPGNELGVNFA